MTVYTTLAEAIKAGTPPDNQRIYRVESPISKNVKAVQFVVANSPGTAALECCDVERVSQRELLAAAFEELGVNIKQ